MIERQQGGGMQDREKKRLKKSAVDGPQLICYIKIDMLYYTRDIFTLNSQKMLPKHRQFLLK
jgi:hypothetical protein